MDDLFLCPDCLTLHEEPFDAALGHVVRCLDCAVAPDAAPLPAARKRPVDPRALLLPLRPAA
jgi:hypothetical protein